MGKSILTQTKRSVNRATAISFVILLFGALGAGFFFVIQNLFGIEHIMGALEPELEKILWFVLFWATDFFYIGFTVVLCYLIAGIPAVAPAMALSVYFAHFAGTPVQGTDAYFAYFSTPLNSAGGANIGYMGYLIMALILAFLIKYLYIGWDNAKASLGRKWDKGFSWLKNKIKFIPKEMTCSDLLDNVDLIVLILIIPVASAAVTLLCIRYGIQLPFSALGEALIAPLKELSASGIVLTGVVFGLMIGFDLIGPVSMSAFAVATAAFMDGNAQLMTIYGACFITIGWVPFFAVILTKVFKKGPKSDNDDFNLAVSGPINAFFENVKLTVAFAMPYAYRSPFTVIPGLMAGGAVTGLLTSAFGIVNTAYLTELPKYGGGRTFEQLFRQGEYYISFTLPLRSGDWLSCRIPLFFIILFGGLCGGAVIYTLKRIAIKNQIRRGTYVESSGDIVVEMRLLAKSLKEKHRADDTKSKTEQHDKKETDKK